MARRFERLLVGPLVLALAGLAGAQSQPALHAYAILGADAVRLTANVRVQRGAVGATTGNVRLAGSARVQGAVVAPSVRVARGVRVGRLFCGSISGGVFGPGVVGGPTVGGSLGSERMPPADDARDRPGVARARRGGAGRRRSDRRATHGAGAGRGGCVRYRRRRSRRAAPARARCLPGALDPPGAHGASGLSRRLPHRRCRDRDPGCAGAARRGEGTRRCQPRPARRRRQPGRPRLLDASGRRRRWHRLLTRAATSCSVPAASIAAPSSGDRCSSDPAAG